MSGLEDDSIGLGSSETESITMNPYWKDLLQQHEDLLETMAWIEPALLELVDQKRFSEVYELGPKWLER